MADSEITKPTQDFPTVTFALNVTVFVIGILSIVTNGALLVVTFLDPLKKLKRPSIYFITSLSFADFLTAIASCMYAFRNKISPNPIFQAALGATIWSSVQNSFITVLFMAAERLFVAKEPLRVRRIITKRRTIVAVALTWFVSVISGGATGVPYPYKSQVKFSLLMEFMFVVLVMILIYLRILVLLKKSDKLLKGKRFPGKGRSRCRERSTAILSQHNLNVVVFVMAVILISTVVPHLIIGLAYHGFMLFCEEDSCALTPALKIAPLVSFPVEMLHFVLNPVVYAWRLREYRKSLCYYLSRRKTEGQQLCGLKTETTSNLVA